MPPHFVGREDLVASLAARLISGEERAVALEGLPGVGKTTLAAALAHHREVLEHFKDGVLWASLGPKGEAFSALAGLAQALGVDISELIHLEDRHRAVKDLIGQRQLLLVIDDVWEIKTAQDLKCGGPNCRHLLTSREPDIAAQFAGKPRAGKVPTLEDEAAYQLLEALAPEACAADPAAARQLSDAVGGLPLALELIGGYLAAPENSLFPGLRQAALVEMADPARRLELASVRLGDRRAGEVSLKQTILFSLETLPEQARAAFYALGAFAPKPERFHREAAEAVTQADTRTLALLVARNLLEIVDPDREQLALHQTLADVARTATPHEAAARHREFYLALVDQDREDWRRIEPVYGQIQWAWSNLPVDEGLLEWVWGLRLYQTRRGLWRDQITWIERGLRVAGEQGLRQDQGVLLNNLAGVYQTTGQPGKALEFYQQALPIRREVGDLYGESVTRYNLASIYRDQGRLGEAVAEMRRVVELDRQTSHPDLESDLAFLRELEERLEDDGR